MTPAVAEAIAKRCAHFLSELRYIDPRHEQEVAGMLISEVMLAANVYPEVPQRLDTEPHPTIRKDER